MPDYIYCGTDAQVSMDNTRALLKAAEAIWCPPPLLRPWHVRTEPAGGERVWLCWSPTPEGPLSLLAGGRLLPNPRALTSSPVIWTDPGARATAIELGYTGPTNMTFLKLVKVRFLDRERDLDLVLPSGLSELAPRQASLLSSLLPIPS